MRCWLLASLCLFPACAPPEKVPSTDGLFGYWRPADGEQTVFAFASPEEAEALFNLSCNMLPPQTKPVSAVYTLDSLVQLATFEANSTELKQTVLADASNPPGTTFSTRIYEFERGVKLVLESKTAGGPRRWDGYPFCPRSRDFGWGELNASPCSNALATGGSLAFDKQGRLFAFTGAAPGVSPSSTCPPTPALLETNRGCGTALLESPNSRLSSTRVFDDGVLRIAYVHFDSSLRVRERLVGASDFTETTLVTLTNLEDLLLLDHGGPLVLTGGRLASGAVLAYRKDATGWNAAPLKPTASGMPLTGLVTATVDRSTKLWLATASGLFHEGDTTFESVSVPGAVTSLYVDPEDVLHAAMNTPRGLEYAVLRGTEWERHVMDSTAQGVIVTHGTRPYRLMTTVPFPEPWSSPALITLHEDGRLESEVTAGASRNFLPTVNSTSFAVGPSGEIAASLTGETVMTRSPRGRLYPKAQQLQIVVEGPPLRVSSLDGRFSCDGSCTVDATLGDRIAFTVEKKPGVLATFSSCDRPGRPASAPCFISVVPGIAGSLATNPVFKVVTRPTPLQSAFVASNAQGLSTTFGISGDWVAVGMLFAGNATQFVLDDVSFPVTGTFQSGGLALVNRSTKSALFVALPSSVVIERVQPDGGGGLWAVLSTSNQAVQLAGATLGASGANVLSFVHLTAAAVIDLNVTLGSFPRAMPAGYLRPAIGANGSAAVVFSRGTALTQLGVTETNALVRVDSAGTRTVHGFTGSQSGSGHLSMVDENRIAFAMNPAAGTTVFLWANAQLQQLAMPGATAQAIHCASSEVAVAVSTAMSPLTVSGRMADGRRHVVLLDGALAATATFSLPEPVTAPFSWGLGMTSKGIGFLSDGQLHWLANATLERLRPASALPTTAMPISGVPGPGLKSADDSLWLLARPDADFGVTGSTAIGQLGLF